MIKKQNSGDLKMFATRPFNFSQVHVEEKVNGYDVSVAFDDSCRNSGDLTRGDIRVYHENSDITDNVCRDIFGEVYTIIASIENLIKVYEWAKTH